MTLLLDTDICIYWLKGHPQVTAQIQRTDLNQIAISVITVAELYYGAYLSERISANLQRAHTFVAQLAILSLDDKIMQQFGYLKAQLRRQGQLLPDFDLLIASTALAYDCILVTNNYRHYQRIPDLHLENWIAKP